MCPEQTHLNSCLVFTFFNFVMVSTLAQLHWQQYAALRFLIIQFFTMKMCHKALKLLPA